MVDLNCKFSSWEFKRCSFQVWALYLLILCSKKVLGKFGQKLQNDQLDLKISILGLVPQILVFYVAHFDIKKDFCNILVKSIVYRVSLSSSRSNKNNSSQQTQQLDAYHTLNLVCNVFPKYRPLDQETYQKESLNFR